jgi:hypothetical protein
MSPLKSEYDPGRVAGCFGGVIAGLNGWSCAKLRTVFGPLVDVLPDR